MTVRHGAAPPSFGRGELFVFAAALSICSCKSKAPPSEPSASPSASPAPRAEKPRCRAIGNSFAIGERTPVPAKVDAGDDDDSNEVELPFAVEIGAATVTQRGFAVGGLRAQAGGAGAFVALVGEAGRGRLVDLGRTFGGSDPPRPAARGEHVVVVVPDSNPHGARLRLAAIADAANEPHIVWGAELEEGRDESPAFDVEVGERRAVVVWDEIEKKKNEPHGVVRGISFDPSDPSNATRPRALSSESRDVEAPRLAPRPGGFWLAWLTRPHAVRKSNATKPASVRPKPAASADEAPSEKFFGDAQGAVELVPLDDNGVPGAEPRQVSPENAELTAFDVAAVAGGAALVAWREEPDASHRAAHLHLVRVGLDGSQKETLIADEGETSTPALIAAFATPTVASPPLFIALSSPTEATRLLSLGADGTPLDALADDPAIRGADPLVAKGHRLLVERPRGLGVDLEVMECMPGSPSLPDAGSVGGPE